MCLKICDYQSLKVCACLCFWRYVYTCFFEDFCLFICEGLYLGQKEPQKALDVKFYHKKSEIFFFAIWNHGNHGTLFLFNTHECQEIQIKNSFDPIWSFGLVKDFWKWNILSFKKDIFTKDFLRTYILKISW
jgi:hypothetical protein